MLAFVLKSGISESGNVRVGRLFIFDILNPIRLCELGVWVEKYVFVQIKRKLFA